MTRWLYIKNGDVVAQVRRTGIGGAAVVGAGPDAFLSDFLHGIRGAPALLISWCPGAGEFSAGDRRAISYRVSGSRFGRAGNVLLRFMATLRALREIVRFRPERIVCGRVGPMLWLTAVYSALTGCPFIHSRHNSLYEQQSRWYQRLLARLDVFAIRRAMGVIAHGPFLAAQMREIGVPAGRVHEFDVSFAEFQSLATGTGPGGQAGGAALRTILYVGRVDRTKGVFDLLHATLPLLDSQAGVMLRYVGDGPDLGRLEQEILDRGVAGRVVCAGSVGHADLPQLLQQAYVVVTPTRREFPEGRCMAAMEALAVSTPVIAPASGPFPFLVRDGVNGLLYEPDSVPALAGALARIIRDAGLYDTLKQGAQQSARELRTPVRTFHAAVELAFEH